MLQLMVKAKEGLEFIVLSVGKLDIFLSKRGAHMAKAAHDENKGDSMAANDGAGNPIYVEEPDDKGEIIYTRRGHL